MGMAERVEAARRRWNGGDLDAYLTLYDPAIRLHGLGPKPFDQAAARDFYRMVWQSLGAEGRPGPDLTFFETLEDGDLYACRFRMSGLHRGPFLGVPATGRAYALDGITTMRFRPDHKSVLERHVTADLLGLLVQLGALPPPA